VIISPLDCNTTLLLPDGRTAAVITTEMTFARWSTGLPAPSVKPGEGFTLRRTSTQPQLTYSLSELEPVAEPPAPPEPAPPSAPVPTLAERASPWLDHVSTTGRLLGTAGYQRPTLGGLDPDNRVLELPGWVTTAEARWDLSVDVWQLQFMAKPRFTWTWEELRQGPDAGDSSAEADLLLLEGTARANLFDRVFLSFGRENLQWGPAQTVNPSNPFFFENGRENPIREIPGLDFFRAVWLPSYNWTFTWLTNTGKGEGNFENRSWHPAHALKAEYVGYSANAGVLVHGGDEFPTSLRGYFHWTASEGASLYGEASIAEESGARYPTETGSLEERDADDGGPTLFGLIGSSYTFVVGPTVYLEYIYNGEGYTDAEAERLFDLGYAVGAGVEAGLLDPADLEPTDTRLRLLRRNYLSVQYLQTEIRDRFTVLLRWTQNLDDSSGLGSTLLEWNLADRWRLYAYGDGGSGDGRSEFGSVVRWRGFAGVELSLF
jgi:hypothetical protein